VERYPLPEITSFSYGSCVMNHFSIFCFLVNGSYPSVRTILLFFRITERHSLREVLRCNNFVFQIESHSNDFGYDLKHSPTTHTDQHNVISSTFYAREGGIVFLLIKNKKIIVFLLLISLELIHTDHKLVFIQSQKFYPIPINSAI